MITAMQVFIYVLFQSCSLPEGFEDLNQPYNALVFYLVYGFSITVVAGVSFFTVKYLWKPKEKSIDHIKNKILTD